VARDKFSLEMTADPNEFVEATKEFSSRRIISREEADKLELYARRRAWWISGVAQMDVVNDVHQSIQAALKSGVPFEEWKKEIGPKLEAAWGRKDSPRILTIFRNATTQAYNAGRWEQMTQPHVAETRPYVQYDVVDDLRTSDICKPLRKVIAPIDSVFVLTHNPPLHHRCRTGLESLRRSKAEKKGITSDADLPDIGVTPGFGHPPTLTVPPTPSERTKPPDPDLQLEAAKKAAKHLQKRAPVKVKIDPKHTPEYWEEHYRAKYGGAARQVGYGRAIHERAKAMQWSEAISAAKELRDAVVPGFVNNTVHYLEVAERYGTKDLGLGIGDDAEAARLLAAHAKIISFKRAPIKLQPLSHLPSANRLAGAAKWYENFASGLVDVPDVEWTVYDDPKWRGYIYARTRRAHLGTHEEVHTWVHEWGHAVEAASESTLRKVVAFRAAREGNDTPKRLSEVMGTSGYEDDEFTREDRYWKAYAGKVYRGDSSEVLSTLFGDIAEGKAGYILRKDPESLYFGLGILAGY
jgi:SPP1 gp7 family putative phage head morphogenesis protein